MKKEWKSTKAMADYNLNIAVIGESYSKNQLPNQQCGTDEYVDIIDLRTGQLGSVKIYINKTGKHIKKGEVFYLDRMKKEIEFCMFQYRLISKKEN